MKPDDTVCYCYNVSLRKLRSFARRERPSRASRMSECLGAGTGCGWCIPILKRICDAAGDQPPEAVTDLSPAEYAARRRAYIAEKRPRHTFE